MLSTDAAQQAQLKEMLDVTGRAYFAQEAAEKQKHGDTNSLGYANNLGYVKVEGAREYIKVPAASARSAFSSSLLTHPCMGSCVGWFFFFCFVLCLSLFAILLGRV